MDAAGCWFRFPMLLDWGQETLHLLTSGENEREGTNDESVDLDVGSNEFSCFSSGF